MVFPPRIGKAGLLFLVGRLSAAEAQQKNLLEGLGAEAKCPVCLSLQMEVWGWRVAGLGLQGCSQELGLGCRALNPEP